MSLAPTIATASPPTSASPGPGNRASLCKRKPPPALTTCEYADPRYPPFDLEDPFASLTELRRRSYSFTCSLDQRSSNHDLQPARTAPFDIARLSPKAFPSSSGSRYTLNAALPVPFYPFEAGPDVAPADAHTSGFYRLGADSGADAAGYLELGVLQPVASVYGRSDVDKSNPGDTRSQRTSGSNGRTYDTNQDRDRHQRRYSHIAAFFRDASPTQPQRSHYIPRKVSSLSYMYTPPLTPDLSASSSRNSSSTSSLLGLAMSSTPTPRAAAFADRALAPPDSRSPSPSGTSLIKKLLHKRSASSLSRLKWNPACANEKPLPVPDLPMSAPSPTLTFSFPRSAALMSVSDISLSSARGVSSDPFRYMPPVDREDEGYASVPELRRSVPDADLDAGLVPRRRRNRLFSFGSRSLLRPQVELYEATRDKKEQFAIPVINYPFDEYALPTPEQLHLAVSLPVVAESGVRVRFGDLWEHEKTVVIFIRHFRFSTCQDYVRSIGSEVDVTALEKAGLKIVIVGVGSHSLIAPYKHITGAQIPIYTDPTLSVHRALGMSLKTTDPGPESECGHYISSGNSGRGGLRRTFADARRFVLPLFERGGDSAQLGGEFVLGPNLTCAYAHRMRHTRAHAPILDIVAASGVQTPALHRAHRMMQLRREQDHGVQLDSISDEEAWMAQRRRSLARLKRKRQNRRAGGIVATAAKHVGEPLDTKRCRFPVVEEDDEEEDELYATASESDPLRYNVKLDIQQQ
ncbi:hypothetical protein M0805_001734 [Coniferiporia weirii]|nr:hypothetical protein M0805_001734 [Coniferiporia weirii]